LRRIYGKKKKTRQPEALQGRREKKQGKRRGGVAVKGYFPAPGDTKGSKVAKKWGLITERIPGYCPKPH